METDQQKNGNQPLPLHYSLNYKLHIQIIYYFVYDNKCHKKIADFLW